MKQERLVLNGKTLNLADNMAIQSNNFNVDSQGNMTCNNATITGGVINLPILSNIPRFTIGDPNNQTNGNTMWISDNKIVNTNTNGCQIALETGNREIYIADSSNATFIYPNLIETPQLIQSSLETKKKNFEKFENALEIIKNVDIYKYNLKSESDTDKKHIGFVIGDNYKYSKELTSNKNDGADIYSLASCCLEAIKEQQEEIEKLKKKIEEMEEKINGSNIEKNGVDK